MRDLRARRNRLRLPLGRAISAGSSRTGLRTLLAR